MNKEIAIQLKARRLKKGMTLNELSERTGIDKANLSRIENAAKANIKLETLERICTALELRVTITEK